MSDMEFSQTKNVNLLAQLFECNDSLGSCDTEAFFLARQSMWLMVYDGRSLKLSSRHAPEIGRGWRLFSDCLQKGLKEAAN